MIFRIIPGAEPVKTVSLYFLAHSGIAEFGVNAPVNDTFTGDCSITIHNNNPPAITAGAIIINLLQNLFLLPVKIA